MVANFGVPFFRRFLLKSTYPHPKPRKGRILEKKAPYLREQNNYPGILLDVFRFTLAIAIAFRGKLGITAYVDVAQVVNCERMQNGSYEHVFGRNMRSSVFVAEEEQ